MKSHHAEQELKRLWSFLSDETDALKVVQFSGPTEQILPSIFDLTAFSMAAVAVANLAAARVKSLRFSAPLESVEVNTLESVAAFKSESLLRPIGWKLPPLWDSIAGDYQAKDGFVRLHTNYASHRQAALAALGIQTDDRELVAREVSKFSKVEVEERVLRAGGCAAAEHSREEWLQTEIGEATRNEIPIHATSFACDSIQLKELKDNDRPFSGVKVLDLTRVIAGPECTKFLSAQGAEVIRIDPPGFEEVPAALPDTTVGKKSLFVDLRSTEGRKFFEKLVSEAHVIVISLRMEALSKLGYSNEVLRKLNPQLIIAQLNAYGFHPLTQNRRGFDSLVQMSTGITAEGKKQTRSQKPMPMPAQALDHGAGFVMAAAVCEAIVELIRNNRTSTLWGSLIGLSHFLFAGPKGDLSIPMPVSEIFENVLIQENSFWGPLFRVPSPGRIGGKRSKWEIEAGPLGRHIGV